MRNWKTTFSGILGAASYAALAYVQSGKLEPKEIAIVAAIAAVGAVAKDLDVTGTKPDAEREAILKRIKKGI